VLLIQGEMGRSVADVVAGEAVIGKNVGRWLWLLR